MRSVTVLSDGVYEDEGKVRGVAAMVDECGEVIQSYTTEQAVEQTNTHPYACMCERESVSE